MSEPTTPKAMEGTWMLVAPNGKEYAADSPLRCLKMEMDERVPPSVALARVLAIADEPDFAERHVQLGKFYSAKNTDELIDRMEGHIARLQEKVQMMTYPQPSARPQRVREG
jgi:hypothetical protein